MRWVQENLGGKEKEKTKIVYVLLSILYGLSSYRRSDLELIKLLSNLELRVGRSTGALNKEKDDF